MSRRSCSRAPLIPDVGISRALCHVFSAICPSVPIECASASVIQRMERDDAAEIGVRSLPVRSSGPDLP